MTVPGPSSRAPLFELPDLNGQPLRLQSFLERGPVWLLFMKESCPTCALAAPWVERLHGAVGGRGASVVVVMEDSSEAAARLAVAHGWTMPVAVESPPWPVSAAYDLRAVPTMFLIDADGTIGSSGEGFLRDEWNAVADRLAARTGRPGYVLINPEDGAPALRPG